MNEENHLAINTDVRIPTAFAHLENTLSIAAYRSFVILILLGRHLKPDEEGFYVIDSNIKKLFLLACNNSIDSKKYNKVYSALDELYEQSIKYNTFGVDSRGPLKERFLISLSNDPTESESGLSGGKGWKRNIYFKYHPEAEKIIKKPNVFGLPYLLMMAVLSGDKFSYPFYIYISDAFARNKKNLRISFIDLRKIIGLEQNSYKDWRDFKKIIISLFAKINDKTEYFCEYDLYKDGGKFSGMEIKIKKQPMQLSIFDAINNEEADKISEILTGIIGKGNLLRTGRTISIEHNFELEELIQIVNSNSINIDTKLIKKTLDTVGREGVLEIYQYAVNKINTESKENPNAYIATCLLKKYGLKTEEERNKIKEKELKALREEERKAKEKLVSTYQEQYKNEKKTITRSIFKQIIEDKVLFNQFLNEFYKAKIEKENNNKLKGYFEQLKGEGTIPSRCMLWGFLDNYIEETRKADYQFSDFKSWLSFHHIDIERSY